MLWCGPLGRVEDGEREPVQLAPEDTERCQLVGALPVERFPAAWQPGVGLLVAPAPGAGQFLAVGDAALAPARAVPYPGDESDQQPAEEHPQATAGDVRPPTKVEVTISAATRWKLARFWIGSSLSVCRSCQRLSSPVPVEFSRRATSQWNAAPRRTPPPP